MPPPLRHAAHAAVPLAVRHDRGILRGDRARILNTYEPTDLPPVRFSVSLEGEAGSAEAPEHIRSYSLLSFGVKAWHRAKRSSDALSACGSGSTCRAMRKEPLDTLDISRSRLKSSHRIFQVVFLATSLVIPLLLAGVLLAVASSGMST